MNARPWDEGCWQGMQLLPRIERGTFMIDLRLLFFVSNYWAISYSIMSKPRRYSDRLAVRIRRFFLRLCRRFFPVNEVRAVKIAMKQVTKIKPPVPAIEDFKLAQEMPTLYNAPKEPCWTIYAPWYDGYDGSMLRSSHVILVSKQTGEILYDGSAHDE